MGTVEGYQAYVPARAKSHTSLSRQTKALGIHTINPQQTVVLDVSCEKMFPSVVHDTNNKGLFVISDVNLGSCWIKDTGRITMRRLLDT